MAQTGKILQLWPGKVPGETEAKHAAQIYKANTSGVNIERISNITDPILRVYKPLKNANGAAVIICPGGGNKYLAINLEGTEIAEWLVAKGYLALVLEYRVPLKNQGSFQDIQRAVRLIRSNAYDWKLKSDRIGVMGFSAGGNLAAQATTGFKIKSYLGEDNIDSISCRPNFSILIYPGSLTGSDKKLMSELLPSEETPPVFIFAASDDQYGIPFQFSQELRNKKLPFELHVVPKGGHGYGIRKGNPAAESWPGLLDKWLTGL
ncbi:hypothetical protein ASG14_07005 [Pedobacter sp. Leaf194]|nr:hypothetical protein ASG14_07005 [Pedobacter sp. Leaf194]